MLPVLASVAVLLALPFVVTAVFRGLARLAERRSLRQPPAPPPGGRATLTTVALAALALLGIGASIAARALPDEVRGLAVFLGAGALLAGWFAHSVPGHRRARKYALVLVGATLLSTYPFSAGDAPFGPLALGFVAAQVAVLLAATAYATLVLRPDAPLEGASGAAAHRWYRRLTIIQGADVGSLALWAALSFTGLGSAYVVLRYAAKEKLLQRPYLYLRSFDQRTGPRVFAELIGPALTRRGPFFGLVHAAQPQSTLQAGVPLLWSSNFSIVGNDHWREWVLDAMDRAKGVILDTTGDTPGLQWEIEQALARVPHERLLVLRGPGQGPLAPGVNEVSYDLDGGLDEARAAIARWGSGLNERQFGVADPAPARSARRWRFFGAYDLAALMSGWLLLLAIPAVLAYETVLGYSADVDASRTRLYADALRRELQVYGFESASPTCDAGLERVPPDRRVDAWGTPLRVDCARGPLEATITSAGPDRAFGTADDVSVE